MTNLTELTTADEQFRMAIPDVIAHRGYSAKNPENTILSFKSAVESGTTALEGDIRLTKDNEIIMMHDLTLQRTTTGTGPVRDNNWQGGIDQLVTKKEPCQPIPRLNDFLDFLIEPEVAAIEGLYMIIDIKFDTPIEIMDFLSVLLSKYTSSHPNLYNKLIIGVWSVDFLKKAQTLLPEFKKCFIGLSIPAARAHFLDTVDYLSMPFAALADQDGQDFIAEVHERQKKVFTWTINIPEQMKCCVLWGVDGIIGDDVGALLENVRAVPSAIKGQDEWMEYKKSDSFLASRRTQLYYYLLKKVMALASWKFIGA
ncbi:PLC-like phosphodiesterase [Backusella circina FSU 941]|nr:PLC-like phosphodiesterase [Backusella circina FSU 941]